MSIRINIFINIRIIILDASKISKSGCFTLYWFVLVAFSLNSFYSVTARCQQESLECRTEWILFCMNLRLVVNGLLCRYQPFLDWFIFPFLLQCRSAILPRIFVFHFRNVTFATGSKKCFEFILRIFSNIGPFQKNETNRRLGGGVR